MTTDDVVDYVVEFFGTDPSRRSVGVVNGAHSCWYNGPGGRCCAFAIFVKPELRESLVEASGAFYNIKSSKAPLLREQVQHIDHPLFWARVQALHDHNENWSAKGITQIGLARAQLIKNEFQLLNAQSQNTD